jgi:hypothetical protein
MKQPTKGRLRDTLAKAADTIAEKNAEIDRLAALLDGGEGECTAHIGPWKDRVRVAWAMLSGGTFKLRARYAIRTDA